MPRHVKDHFCIWNCPPFLFYLRTLIIVVSLKCTREKNNIRKEHYLQMGAFFWVDGVDVGGALVGVVNVG